MARTKLPEQQKVDPITLAEKRAVEQTTVEMQALTSIVATLSPLEQSKQQAILRAINAYFEFE